MITNIEFRAQMEDLIKKINSSYVKSLDPTVDDYESINYETFKKEFDALIENYTSGGGASSADAVSYDNTDSGLEATDVQGAIDELAEGGGGGSSLYIVKFTITIDMSTGVPSVTCDKPLSEIWQKRPEEIFAYCEAPAIVFLMKHDFPENWWSSQEEMLSAKFYAPVTVSNIMPGIEACFTTCALTLDWNNGTFSGMSVDASAFDEDNVFYIIGLPTDSTGTNLVKGGTVDNWIFTQYSTPPEPVVIEQDEIIVLTEYMTKTNSGSFHSTSPFGISNASSTNPNSIYIHPENNARFKEFAWFNWLLNRLSYFDMYDPKEIIFNFKINDNYYDSQGARRLDITGGKMRLVKFNAQISNHYDESTGVNTKYLTALDDGSDPYIQFSSVAVERYYPPNENYIDVLRIRTFDSWLPTASDSEHWENGSINCNINVNSGFADTHPMRYTEKIIPLSDLLYSPT